MPGSGRLAAPNKSVAALLIPFFILILAGLLQPLAADNWASAGSMISPRTNHTATRLLDGRVLVTGGSNDTGPLASAELYNPDLVSWSPVLLMSVARTQHTATLLANGKVLVVGGTSTGLAAGALASAEVFDPTTNIWSPVAAMNVARYSFTATLLQDGRVLVAGGRNAGGELSSAEIYSPADNVWSPTLAMGTPRSRHAASQLANGYVLITGGSSANTVLSSVEIYDIAQGVWVFGASMNGARYGHPATLLADGRVLVTGGTGASVYLSTAEVYDSIMNSWSETAVPSMSTSRAGHSATLLDDGRVVVAGGVSNESVGAPVLSAEIYDPAENAWSVAPGMSTARVNHSATLLSDGLVLLAGGSNTSSLTLNSAEKFAAQKKQTIAFDALADGLFSDPDFQVVATASSGLPVSFTASGSCSVSGNTVSFIQLGTCTITASQAGDVVWKDAPPVSRSFEILLAVPSITKLSRASGPVGSPVTITGVNFGVHQGASTVTFNGIPATSITNWSAKSITAVVPSGATDGNVVITTTLASNGVPFTVTGPPAITQLSVTSGAVGSVVTITGVNLGAARTTGSVSFNGTPATFIISWNSTSIVAAVPAGATSGNVVVTDGVTSNGLAFTVTVANPEDPANVVTYHNDKARTGQYLNETILNPGNVNDTTFGKLFSYSVDGFVYGQPLYVSNLAIPGKGTRNVVFVVTQHDSIYAFDADSNTNNEGQLWKVSFIDPASGVTSVPPADVGTNDISAEIGITSTPVIDVATNTIYLIAKTKEVRADGAHYLQRLHVLDIRTGAEKLGGPAIIADTILNPDGTYVYVSGPVVAGKGMGSEDGETVKFNALRQLNRAALLLNNGIVYSAWGSHGDIFPYHGWILGFDAQNLAPSFAFNTSPNGQEAGIWMGGDGPSADTAGNIYVATGNGIFAPTGAEGPSYADTLLKLSPTLTGEPGLYVADFFTRWNELVEFANADSDFGSGGVILFPDQPGGQHLMIAGGKASTVYLVDRDNLGGFQRCGPECDDVVQVLPSGTVKAVFSTPAYFNGKVYYQTSGSVLKAFQLQDGSMSPQPVTQSAKAFNYPGSSPSISANGSSSGIVWTLERAANAILHAHDAENLSNELFSSDTKAANGLGGSVKYSVPTVAKGKVYVGTRTDLAVYGLLPPPAPQLSVTYDGRILDRVGNGEAALSADGSLDAMFGVTLLPGSANRTVTQLSLSRNSGGQVWDTISNNSTRILGAAAASGGVFLNSVDGTVNFPLAAGGSFKVFASDDQATLFAIGSSFSLTATFSDGLTASSVVTVSIDNVALAANGGVATASSTYSPEYVPAGAINGDRKGVSWGNGGGWNDATVAGYPDWLQVDFNGTKSIQEIDVFTVQDNYESPIEPSSSLTFSLYGVTDFQVQYWNGTSWQNVPGGVVTGNNRVWSQFTFSSITTTKIRVLVSGALNSFSRITEVEAWGVPTVASPPPTIALNSPANNTIFTSPATVTLSANASANAGTINQVAFYAGTTLVATSTNTASPYTATWNNVTGGTYLVTAVASDTLGGTTTSAPVSITVTGGTPINVASSANGAAASASSFYSAEYSPNGAIDGDRKGTSWGNGGGWNDATVNSWPDWLQVDFAGPQTIKEIDVFAVQDAYANPTAPTLGMPFSLHGVTDFQAQYWDGFSWVIVPGGNITGNNQVWRQILFAPITTSRIRIYVTGALASWSRITEVEAYSDTSFVNAFPGPFQKNSPANGATAQAVAPTLGWGTGSTATSYEYCVDTTNNNSCDTSWTSTAGTSAVPSGLSAGVTYFWQVRARNSSGTTNADLGSWWSFTTAMNGHVNVAAAVNGGIASASSFYSVEYAPSGAINGDRKGVSWGNGGGWNDATIDNWPDWLQVDFAGSKVIDRVDVFSVQDAYANPAEPTLGMPFSLHGITGFQVQYWNGSSWLVVPGGDISGNNQVWRQVAFAPVTTSRIRINVTGALASWSRITEVEVYGTDTSGVPNNSPTVVLNSPSNAATYSAPATVSLSANANDTDGTITQVAFYAGSTLVATSTSTANSYTATWDNVAGGNYTITAVATDNVGSSTTSTPAGITVTGSSLVNFALATNGGVATASSSYSNGYAPAGAINGDRKGLSWGAGGGWSDANPYAWPSWLQVDFNGAKTINEVNVFTVQDNYSSPIEPTLSMTFSEYGITNFQVQYWTGTIWQDVPNGVVIGNNHIWNKFTFSPITTTKIRVLVSSARNAYSAITEVEAYGTP